MSHNNEQQGLYDQGLYDHDYGRLGEIGPDELVGFVLTDSLSSDEYQHKEAGTTRPVGITTAGDYRDYLTKLGLDNKLVAELVRLTGLPESLPGPSSLGNVAIRSSIRPY